MPPVDEISSEEREAVRLRFRHLNPHAPVGAEPTLEQFDTLLIEVRERSAAIEAETLRMLSRATRNPATRSGLWSRHAQMALLVLSALLGLFLLVWVLAKVFA